MKLRYLFNCSVIIIFVAAQLWAQNTNPVVSNVTIIDSISTTGNVHIYYDVTDAEQSTVTINVRAIKTDEALGGVSPLDDPTYNLACTLANGDIGINVATGINKHIVWNFKYEYERINLNDYNTMVIANDNIDGGSPCPGEPTIEYAGKIYNTVQIGDQCWFKENLDIGTMINNSVNQSDNGIIEKYCYENDTAYCITYGGLYQWPEIVHYLNGASYDTKPEPYLSSNQKLQGICPEGWRLPTGNDYELLISMVNHDTKTLKAVGQGTGCGAGTNTSGFSALLNGNWTYFWTSSDGINLSYCLMLSGSDSITYGIWDDLKIFGYNVRCIKGEGGTKPDPPILIDPPDGSTDVVFYPTLSWSSVSGAVNYILELSTSNTFSHNLYYLNGIKSTNQKVMVSHSNEYFWRVRVSNSTNFSNWSEIRSFTTSANSACPGIPTINYAGKTYNTVQIGDQCWLKENLNVGTMLNSSVNSSNNGIIEKYCYNSDSVNCDIYGGLYTWNEAINYPIWGGSRGICPEGWHMPHVSEFNTLAASVGNVGNQLKREDQGSGSGIGTNESDFSALLFRRPDGSGLNTSFWSSDRYSGDPDEAGFLSLYYSAAGVYVSEFPGTYATNRFNIRCIKD